VFKPYFVGQRNLESVWPRPAKKEWRWEEKEGTLRQMVLHEEHLAVRRTAGLFDVAHMELVRFRLNEKGVRMARLGDPVVDRGGRYIGRVTGLRPELEAPG